MEILTDSADQFVGNNDSAARRHRKQLFFETVVIKGTKEHSEASNIYTEPRRITIAKHF